MKEVWFNFFYYILLLKKPIQIDYKYSSSCLQKENITMAFYQDFENKSESLTLDQTSRPFTFLTLLLMILWKNWSMAERDKQANLYLIY